MRANETHSSGVSARVLVVAQQAMKAMASRWAVVLIMTRSSISPAKVKPRSAPASIADAKRNVSCWPLTSFTALQKFGRYRMNSGQPVLSGLIGSDASDPQAILVSYQVMRGHAARTRR